MRATLLRPSWCLATCVAALSCAATANAAESEPGVTYAKEISRIVQDRCHECHRKGMIGPFTLMDYDSVKRWSAMIKEVVEERRMPPWHADSRYGHFSNNRNMPQDEVGTLISWIDNGMPFGDKSDLPEPKQYAEGWVIDEPDVVFHLPEEVTIPADGVVPYLYFRVPTNFKQDMWISQAEARPDNRAVVHHIIVTSRAPNSKGRRGRGMVAGTAPGDPPTILPPGAALKVPAGADLVFQMHYTPTGKEEKDRSMIGLVFYKEDQPPRQTVRTKGISNHKFRIPAGESNHLVESSYTLEADSKLFSFMPHMHLRGKDFKYTAVYPDGRSEVLLSVPAYDFNWQNKYKFAEPVLLPKGTRIDCVAHFDNSSGNPANPDATEDVVWGDQTWEEMMIGWTTFLKDLPDRSRPVEARRPVEETVAEAGD